MAIGNELTLISKPLAVKQIWNGIFNSRGAKSPESKRAGVAVATGFGRFSITGPGKFKRRPKPLTKFHYLRLLQGDHRSSDFNLSFRSRAARNHLLEGFVKLRSAVRIA